MPDEDVLVMKTTNRAGDQLVKIDPLSGRSTVWIDKIPGESFMISPDKRSIYIYEEVKGPEKDKLLIRRLSPDDRQPGARDRQALYRYDIATGVYEPVLYGYRSVSLLDFSADEGLAAQPLRPDDSTALHACHGPYRYGLHEAV